MELRPKDHSSRVEIATGIPNVGDLLLWIPEAICSDTGICAVYPVGTWETHEGRLEQRIVAAQSVGPGNCPKVDDHTFECSGIRIPADSPVEWRTIIERKGDAVDFALVLTNVGGSRIRKAGAAVCLRFLNPSWWSDRRTFVLANGRLLSLSTLGRSAGRPNPFQAYLVEGESYQNIFYREFWGFNPQGLDTPVMVSENAPAGRCVGIESERAYFLHSNKGNPCTDIMLAFGDIEPGVTAEARGRVWIEEGHARELIAGKG